VLSYDGEYISLFPSVRTYKQTLMRLSSFTLKPLIAATLGTFIVLGFVVFVALYEKNIPSVPLPTLNGIPIAQKNGSALMANAILHKDDQIIHYIDEPSIIQREWTVDDHHILIEVKEEFNVSESIHPFDLLLGREYFESCDTNPQRINDAWFYVYTPDRSEGQTGFVADRFGISPCAAWRNMFPQYQSSLSTMMNIQEGDLIYFAIQPHEIDKLTARWEMPWIRYRDGHPAAPAACNDTKDNDDDTLTDCADPGCHTDGDAANAATCDPNDADEESSSSSSSSSEESSSSSSAPCDAAKNLCANAPLIFSDAGSLAWNGTVTQVGRFFLETNGGNRALVTLNGRRDVLPPLPTLASGGAPTAPVFAEMDGRLYVVDGTDLNYPLYFFENSLWKLHTQNSATFRTQVRTMGPHQAWSVLAGGSSHLRMHNDRFQSYHIPSQSWGLGDAVSGDVVGVIPWSAEASITITMESTGNSAHVTEPSDGYEFRERQVTGIPSGVIALYPFEGQLHAVTLNGAYHHYVWGTRIAVCSDGVIQNPNDAGTTENCDDRNGQSGDGCSATCQLESGWNCSGQPSVCTNAVCGNFKLEAGEVCDVNTDDQSNGIACSQCRSVNPGWRCDSATVACWSWEGCTSKTVSICVPQCGDGRIDGGGSLREQCDDRNLINGDGCSNGCTIETPLWSCPSGVQPSNCLRLLCANGIDDDGDGVTDCADSQCAATSSACAVCGDSVVQAGEDCDVGDTNNGDGCDSTCHYESAWQCSSYFTGLAKDISDIATSDFNEDGFEDIAAMEHWKDAFNNDYYRISVMMNNGDGTFGVPSFHMPRLGSFIRPLHIYTGDVNKDGHDDLLLLTNDSNHQIALLPGLGNGTFGAKVDIVLQYPNGTHFQSINDMQMVDLNGDSDLDLILHSGSSGPSTFAGGIVILLGQTGYNFTYTATITSPTPVSLSTAFADWNGDGLTDIAYVDDAASGTAFRPNALRINKANNDGTYTHLRTLMINPAPDANSGIGYMVSGDINGDELEDIVIADYWTPRNDKHLLRIFLSTGNGGFIEQAPIPENHFSNSFQMLYKRKPIVADMNHDGFDDIISMRSNAVMVHMSNGDGSFAAPQAIPLMNTGLSILHTVDTKNDGYADILAGVMNHVRPLQLVHNNAGQLVAPANAVCE